MAGKDLYPSIRDERKTFRHGTNRMVEIALRHELDDVARKSLDEIAVKKERQKLQPLDSEEYTSRRLQPAFTPRKVREKIKREPVFHDELLEVQPKKPGFMLIPNIPPYNPLDKFGNVKELDREGIKKYPYNREETVTTEDLQKSRVTSVGVVPTRVSASVPGLRVVMEGKPVAESTDHALDKMEEANIVRPESPQSAGTPDELEQVEEEGREDVTKPKEPQKKPAILGSEGTLQKMSLSVRPTRQPHPPTVKRKLRGTFRSARSVASSLRSGEIVLPDDKVYSKYDDAIAGLDTDLEDVETAVGQQAGGELLAPPGTAEGGRRSGAVSSAAQSVKDMLEEAKKISEPTSEPVHKMRRKSLMKKDIRKDSIKKVKGEKGKGKKEDDKEEGPRTERTVDEIIASLRSQSRSGQTTDADRKIQEIMNRVMSRSSAISGESTEEATEKKEEFREIVPEDERKSGPSSVSSSVAQAQGPHDGTTMSPYLTSPSPGGGSRTEQSSPYEPDTDRSEQPQPIKEEKEEEAKEDAKDKEEAVKYLEERKDTDQPPPVPPSTAAAPVVEPLKGLGFSDEEEEEETQVDIQKAWEDLNVPDVTHEDLVGVEGKQKVLEGKHPNLPGFKTSKAPVYSTAISFLSAWKPVAEKRKREDEEEVEAPPSKNIHHFCTVTTEYQLPEQFVNVGRKYHTPSRYEFAMPEQRYRFGSAGPDSRDGISVPGSVLSQIEEEKADSEMRIAAAAQRVLQEVEESKLPDDSLEAWQQRAQQVFDQPQITVEGTSLHIKTDESRLYWDPAPPKLDVAPSKVKDILFPEYQRATAGPQERELQEMLEESSESSEEEEDIEVIEQDREQQEHLQRVLGREHKSYEDLTELVVARRQREIDIKEGRINPYSPLKTEEDSLKDEQEELELSIRSSASLRVKQEPDDSEIFPCFAPLRRSISAPEFDELEDDTLLVPQDYNTAMREIRQQKQNVRAMKLRQKLGEAEPPPQEEEVIEEMKRVEPQEYKVNALKVLAAKKEEPTPAELALTAGRAYVLLPKKKKKKKEPISMGRLDDIERFLSKRPRALVRSESMMKIPQSIERELRVSSRIREGTRRSVPDLLSFEDYSTRKGLQKDDDTREWVREIWNRWFDEVYPPTPSDSDYTEEEEVTEEHMEEKLEEEKKKKRKESLNSAIPDDMYYIEPINETDETLEVYQIIGEEIEKLTEEMNDMPKPKAFDYCRRGALYRKIGYLKAAEDDLGRAIELEPLLLDAYWHRHLLYVLQDKKKEALDDLTFILKHSKTHAGAYRSMAEIYRKQDDTTMAIVNYTQAIKLNPRDHEAFFARAECYEKRGDMLLALEDYSACTKIAPNRTDAILKHGMYYFENKSWLNAINDFTDLLRVDPLNSSARVLRGRAYASMGQWSPAVEDLSAAIHLDPNNWEAFYHRACILRKAHPKRALHDYSVSLLINDSEENIMSYLHRGILYNAMNKPEDAAPDFESVLKLNKEFACAHVNLGLIMMTHNENYHRAIKRFTSAIKVDPTYVRAYVCRGEAYHKVHELKLALRDFTRAIHLRPDVHHYYMYRGQLLLEMGNLDLAAFCVRHASEISSDSSMGKKPTQQAVVQSFLKNYDKAIDALKAGARAKPVASMFMLLGKTQMKAKQFKEAIESFEQALSLYKPWKARDQWPVEAADSHYLIGQCNMELRNYVDALEAFTNAIKLNPNMAEALYQRGTARMKLKLSKGIQDFNRALAINPQIFQAYLSRACFYGMKGQYTKAILNCNEAIKLRPNSVRAYLYRGALKYHIKAYELAIIDLSKAAAVDSTCALAYFNRAVCYQENKDYQKALTDYGIVLLLGESLKLKVLINRGLLYFEKKDYCNALYDFKLASKLSPLDHKILHTLGLCYHKLNQLEEAVNTFTSCLKSQPFFLDGIIARGNVYMDYGHEDGLKWAMCDYQRAVRLDPMCLPARVNLAYTLQVAGKFMQAWRQFTIAIELKPTYKPALEGRSIINLQMSDTFASYQDISAAISVNPTAELLTNRGVIHQFMGDKVNAMRDYQEAIRRDGTYSLAYFNAGNVYFHTRQFSQALEYFSLGIKYNQKDESAFLNRAITKVMLKDATGALEDFKSAIKLSPYSAHMYLNRGNLYASIQQYEKAEKDYSKALDLQPDDALVLKRRADVRGKLGMKDKAIRDYKQAIEIQGRSQFLAKLKKNQIQSC